MKKLSIAVLSFCLASGIGGAWAADSTGNDTMSKGAMKQGSMSESTMTQGTMSQDDRMKQEAPPRDAMGQGSAMNKAPGATDAMKKTDMAN